MNAINETVTMSEIRGKYARQECGHEWGKQHGRQSDGYAQCKICGCLENTDEACRVCPGSRLAEVIGQRDEVVGLLRDGRNTGFTDIWIGQVLDFLARHKAIGGESFRDAVEEQRKLDNQPPRTGGPPFDKQGGKG